MSVPDINIVLSELPPRELLHSPLSKQRFTPLEHISLYSAKEWEIFIEEWAHTQKNHYRRVVRLGGSGDMGIDVAGLVDCENLQGAWDCFQCKHTQNSLPVASALPEIAKIIYYSFKGYYSPPRCFFFITPKGCSTELSKILLDHEQLKSRVHATWSKTPSILSSRNLISLEGDLLEYFEAFDFKIFSYKSALDIIKEHEESPNHIVRFGGDQLHNIAACMIAEKLANYRNRQIREFSTLPTAGNLGSELPITDCFIPEFVYYGDKNTETKFETIKFSEIVNSSDSLIIQGPSGWGKSSALRILVYKLLTLSAPKNLVATRLIIFLELDSTDLDFELLVRKELITRVGLGHEICIEQLSNMSEFVILADGLDETKNPRRIQSSIRSFAARYTNIRIIIASRSLSYGFQLPFRKVSIQGITRYQIKCFFVSSLGAIDGDALFTRLDLRGLLESVKSPLLCWFILVSRRILTNEDTLNIFTLFNSAIRNILEHVDAKQAILSPYSHIETDIVMLTLGSMALQMTSKRNKFMHLSDAERTCQKISKVANFSKNRDPNQIINLAIEGGILIKYNEFVSFSHETIKYFFSALKITDNPPKFRPLLLMNGRKWEDTAVFYIASLAPAAATRELRKMVDAIPKSNQMFSLRFLIARRQIFVVLRSLCQFGSWADQLKSQVVDNLLTIGAGNLYLEVNSSRESNLEVESPRQNAYRELFFYIGSLGNEHALRILPKFATTYKSSILPGFFCLKEPDRSIFLFEIILSDNNDDSSMIWQCAEYLVRNLTDSNFLHIKAILESDDTESKAQLLDQLFTQLARGHNFEISEFEDIASKMRFHLLPSLTAIILNSEDYVCRNRAKQLSIAISEEIGFLPHSVADACLRAINMIPPNSKAIWPLLTTSGDKHSALLGNLVESWGLDWIDCSLICLDVLRYTNETIFSNSLHSLLKNISSDYTEVLSQYGADDLQNIDEHQLHRLSLLYGCTHQIGSIRLYSWIEIIRKYRDFNIEPLLKLARKRLAADDHKYVRYNLFHFITSSVPVDLDDIVEIILSDKDSFLRRIGIEFYSSKRRALVPTPRIWKRIFEISVSDEDSLVRFFSKSLIDEMKFSENYQAYLTGKI